MVAEGAAFIDCSGKVLAAGEDFEKWLSLAPGDPGALRARADRDQALKAFLAGAGPDRIRIAENGGEVELSRKACSAGVLVVATRADAELQQELLEHAVRSAALTGLASGVSHDIRNPLNAMALQLALLSEKLASAGEAVASASTVHLESLRSQIDRVNDVLRRFLDVVEPGAPLGYTDLAGLTLDLVSLFGHDARRRRIEMTCDLAPGAARSSSDPARTGRLLLGLFARALAETPAGARFAVRTYADGDQLVLRIEHARGPTLPEMAHVYGTAAASARAMGGSFRVTDEQDPEALEARIPRYSPP